MKKVVVLALLLSATQITPCYAEYDPSSLAQLISKSAKAGADVAALCAVVATGRIFSEHISGEQAEAEIADCISKRFDEEGLSPTAALALVHEAMEEEL